MPDYSSQLESPSAAKGVRQWLRWNHLPAMPQVFLLAVPVAAWIWLAAAPCAAQPPDGKKDYDRYCAVCHGPKGDGKGVGAYTLSGTNPSDLTHISSKHGGKFPFDDVYAVVDGRKEFPSHERLNMPFFGTNLEMEEGRSPEAKARVDARISAIVRYVETLQQK